MADLDEQGIFRDTKFRQKRKHGAWREVPAPELGFVVADTHAHVHLLSDPALSLARAAVHGVGFVCAIVDPAEDGWDALDRLGQWRRRAASVAYEIEPSLQALCASCPHPKVPALRVAVGVHPHNAKGYDDQLERALAERLRDDERVSAVGEIGLDYHYDLSPRDVQRSVFRRQLALAREAGLPVALHVREAHDDAFAILAEEGFPGAGTLLHCYNLGPEELRRWLDAGCFVAFGGALTFKRAEEVREAAKLVPLDRLLTETDAPYMAPEPLRGNECGPECVVFTAEALARVRGADGSPEELEAFLGQLYRNAVGLLDRPRPEPCPKEEAPCIA